jgi:hypothetical protein
MNNNLPLSATVKPRGPAIILKFAQDLLPLFAGSTRIAASASTHGLVLECLWEPDLDWAADQIQPVFPAELSWSLPQVKYITKAVRDGEVLLEPMLKVHVTTPEEFSGTVLGAA